MKTTSDSIVKVPGRIENLLIRSANWIGDAVMTTPAVRAVRKNFPDAQISLLAKPWVAPVFENNPHIDHVLLYDAKRASETFKMAGMLEQHFFDGAILFQNAFEAAWVAWLAKIPVRIGYDTDLRKILLSHPVRRSSSMLKLHQIHYYNGILEGAGLNSDGMRLELYLSSEDRRSASKILKNCGIGKTDRFVGINPSAVFGSAKQWFPERFAEVSDRLNEKFGTKTVIFGGPLDKDLGENILSMMKTEAVNLSGKTTLNEAMALLALCRLFITNDSGLMHIAAALNVPQVAIFGSTNFSVTAPWSSMARVVRSRVVCSPCMKRQCVFGHKECMTSIRVEKVFSVACHLMDENF
ncbi:MAG: lipopolysaccharide heptosyltransferase II [Desulfobacterales bacterium]